MSDKHKRQPNTILTGQRKSTSNLQKSLCKTIVFFWVHPQGKLLIFHISFPHSRQDLRSVLLRVLLTLGEVKPKQRHPNYV